MLILPTMMLLVPGLISVRILWHDKDISRADYKYIASDYLVYSFLIMLFVFAIMFFSYPNRTISFSVNVPAISHVLSTGFVFKYSTVALLAALALPNVVQAICKIWFALEKKLGNKKQSKGSDCLCRLCSRSNH